MNKENKKNISNGSVQRHRKNENFTIISNDCVFDKPPLSLEAKGLLWQMFSLPDTWNHCINGYRALCGVGERKIKSIFKELKERGYLKIEKISPKDSGTGRFAYIYHIFDECQNNKKQEVQNVPLEIQKQEGQIVGLENVALQCVTVQNSPLNKELKKQNTNNKKIKKDKEEKNTFGEFKNVFLTKDEEQKLKLLYRFEIKFNEGIEILSSYKEGSGKTYKSDYAVLNKHNWVFKKVFPAGLKENNAPTTESGNKYANCYQ